MLPVISFRTHSPDTNCDVLLITSHKGEECCAVPEKDADKIMILKVIQQIVVCFTRAIQYVYSTLVSGTLDFIVFPQVFHEGLKSWSCCQDVNKPVLDFDEFMKIPVSDISLKDPIECSSVHRTGLYARASQ